MRPSFPLRCCIAAAVLSIGALGFGPAQAETLIEHSAQASLHARDLCQMLMHEDADAFTQCADKLLIASPTRTLEQRYAKLGIAYYAWLSATSAAKNGLPTSVEAAEHFVRVFRPMQRRLQVSDEALCATIAGDCVSRNARMLITEREAQDHQESPVRAKHAKTVRRDDVANPKPQAVSSLEDASQ